MAVTPKAKAALVSARELPGLVDAAVKVAAQKVPGVAADDKVTIRWELIGRILRDLKQAQPFADAVSAELKAKGVAVNPAVLIIDKRILAGFFERVNLPQQRQF